MTGRKKRKNGGKGRKGGRRKKGKKKRGKRKGRTERGREGKGGLREEGGAHSVSQAPFYSKLLLKNLVKCLIFTITPSHE